MSTKKQKPCPPEKEEITNKLGKRSCVKRCTEGKVRNMETFRCGKVAGPKKQTRKSVKIPADITFTFEDSNQTAIMQEVSKAPLDASEMFVYDQRQPLAMSEWPFYPNKRGSESEFRANLSAYINDYKKRVKFIKDKVKSLGISYGDNEDVKLELSAIEEEYDEGLRNEIISDEFDQLERNGSFYYDSIFDELWNRGAATGYLVMHKNEKLIGVILILAVLDSDRKLKVKLHTPFIHSSYAGVKPKKALDMLTAKATALRDAIYPHYQILGKGEWLKEEW